MLDKRVQAISDKYTDEKKSELALELAEVQRLCIDKNIPVIIVIDGWESSGKGYMINEIVRELDTKYYRVSVFDKSQIDDDYNYVRQLWKSIPPYGNFRILYRSIYTSLFNDLKSDKNRIKSRIDNIRNQEKLLTDDNTIILKFFLDIDEKCIKENVQKLVQDKYRSFFVTKEDKNQVSDYSTYRKNMSEILELTNFEFAKWQIVNSNNRKEAAKYILGYTKDAIKEKISQIEEKKEAEKEFVYKREEGIASIKDLDLSKSIEKEKYDIEIEKLQEKVSNLAYELYTREIPTVIVFEGIDAAGKGGSISRLLKEIDPRIYSVNPTSVPSDLEKKHHYLWRFYNNLPQPGNIAVFDRSWYGRVLVERVEGFATDYEWFRSYDEINKMELELVNQGVLLVKYHLVISKDEQERRFKDREKEKPYKITDEDWRNRKKWDKYIDAMDDMLHYTSTSYAPWLVVSSQDKRYARIEVLKHFIDKCEEILKRDTDEKK